MRIENNGITPLPSKPTEAVTAIEKRGELNEGDSVRSGQDSVEMSGNARLLAKARSALENVKDTDSERVALLKQQVESGDYTVQVSDLARKLVAKFYPK